MIYLTRLILDLSRLDSTLQKDCDRLRYRYAFDLTVYVQQEEAHQDRKTDRQTESKTGFFSYYRGMQSRSSQARQKKLLLLPIFGIIFTFKVHLLPCFCFFFVLCVDGGTPLQ